MEESSLPDVLELASSFPDVSKLVKKAQCVDALIKARGKVFKACPTLRDQLAKEAENAAYGGKST